MDLHINQFQSFVIFVDNLYMLLESPYILSIHNGLNSSPCIILWSSKFMLFHVAFVLLNCAP